MEPHELAMAASSLFRTPAQDADVVLSTRIRLARNVRGYAFPNRLEAPRRRELEARLKDWIAAAQLAEGLQYLNLEEVRPLEAQVFMERHLISRELKEGVGQRGVTVAPTGHISIMTNEEDHLRMQVLRPGLAMREALDLALQVDDRLERLVPYAFDDQFGYLTSCPTNVGTGLRISVMAHLPGLVLGKQLEKVTAAAGKLGLAVRGFYGEGSRVVGDVVQISNQRTLGASEEDILADLERFVPKVIEYERGVRSTLLIEDRVRIEDKVWRAVGLLRYARRLDSEETMELLSAIRLGVAVGFLPQIDLGEVNELFVMTQPGHLQLMKGRELTPADRDVVRANLLRDRFQPESN